MAQRYFNLRVMIPKGGLGCLCHYGVEWKLWRWMFFPVFLQYIMSAIPLRFPHHWFKEIQKKLLEQICCLLMRLKKTKIKYWLVLTWTWSLNKLFLKSGTDRPLPNPKKDWNFFFFLQRANENKCGKIYVFFPMCQKYFPNVWKKRIIQLKILHSIYDTIRQSQNGYSTAWLMLASYVGLPSNLSLLV